MTPKLLHPDHRRRTLEKRTFGLLILAMLGVVFVSEPALCNEEPAVSNSADQQAEITSKKLLVKTVTGGYEAVFEGVVKVESGDMALTCDRCVIFSEADKQNHFEPKKLQGNLSTSVKTATCSGNVKVVKADIRAEAGKVFFDNAKQTVVLTEKPVVKQGPQTLSADIITIHLDNSDVKHENISTRIKTATFSGKVKVVKGDMRAEAGKAVYDAAKQTVVLTDGPVVRQGSQTLTSPTMLVNLVDNSVEMLNAKVTVIPEKPGQEKKPQQ
jgi:lipopolysaccharide transport protein LptA